MIYHNALENGDDIDEKVYLIGDTILWLRWSIAEQPAGNFGYWLWAQVHDTSDTFKYGFFCQKFEQSFDVFHD